MDDAPHNPPPRCAKHNLAMLWYNIDKRGGGRFAKYRCAICVADAKIKVDRECENWRRHASKRYRVAAQ
jgi:hypothetical protein